VAVVLRALLIALLLTALPVAAGVWVADDETDDTPAAPPPYASTALDDYDTSTVAVTRAGFCDLVVADAVTEALGAEATDEEAWGNGDAAELAPGESDVAHEYGCAWSAGRKEARAWVFAPPVTPDRAGELVDAAAGTKGCVRQEGAASYGEPSVGLVCSYRKRTIASYRGLFGDAWLACSLSLPRRTSEQELRDRAGRWCVAVAKAAATAS